MRRALGFVVLATAVGGCAGTLGGKTRDQLREGITAHQADLAQCYADALQRDREAAGSMAVAIHVKSDETTVHQVDVEDSGISDEEMQACVQRTLSGLTIAKAPSGNVRAHFALDFQPEGELAPEGEQGAEDEGGEEAPAEGEEGAAP